MAQAKSAGQSRSDLRARLYDWECVHVLGRTDQDVGFWLEVARAAPGPCLELACGTGRVSVPLAAAGIDIVGLDYDVMMLTVAAQRERRQRSQVREQRPQPTQQAGARFITSDMRRFALHRQFGAVLIPYNSVQLLTDLADQRACLRLAAAHLAEGGVVGVEVTDFQEGATHASVGEEVLHTGWLGDERVTLIGSLTHDFGRRISRYHRRFLSSGWTREDDAAIRSMNKAELSELLATTDLTPRRWWTEGAVTRVVASVSPVLSSSRCRDEHRGPT